MVLTKGLKGECGGINVRRPINVLLRGDLRQTALQSKPAAHTHTYSFLPRVQASSAVSQLSARGFVNYFGLQRFGSGSGCPTHRVGALLLRGQWQPAVDMLLGPSAEDRPDVAAAKAQYAADRDAKVTPCGGNLRCLTAFTDERRLREKRSKRGMDQRALLAALYLKHRPPATSALEFLQTLEPPLAAANCMPVIRVLMPR